MRRRDRMIQIKTPAEIDAMRQAGLVVFRALERMRAAVAPGVSTADLDAIAEESIRSAQAVPSFKGYRGFPATICASINDEVVHGIPSRRRRLREGDLISLDCGAIVDGWHGDSAVTVPVAVAAFVAPSFLAGMSFFMAGMSFMFMPCARASPDGNSAGAMPITNAQARYPARCRAETLPETNIDVLL